MKIQEKYISRCLQIARNARGKAAPNPSVGAVVTYRDRIIGEGYTAAYGGPHAEVRAIASVTDKELLKEATLYVSLEPCNHHGKTPPCTELIIRSGIPRVVIGIADPHEKVAGTGIARLLEAGCQVTTGVLEAECREHHRRFLTYHEKKRPYILLKWAQSPDGYIAPDPALREAARQPHWITAAASRQLVHKWRAEEQAILVGRATAEADDPELGCRDWAGINPLRILLDPELKVSAGSRLLDGSTPTLVVCRPGSSKNRVKGVDYLEMEVGSDFADRLAKELHARNILSVLVEGGALTLATFLEAGLWDEARVFEGTQPLLRGIPAPGISGRLVGQNAVGPDRLSIWRND